MYWRSSQRAIVSVAAGVQLCFPDVAAAVDASLLSGVTTTFARPTPDLVVELKMPANKCPLKLLL